MGAVKRRRRWSVWGRKCILSCLCGLLLSTQWAIANIGPEDALILVNQNSPTSRYIARMYREFYPAITAQQVLSLSGLTDCSGPTATAADEIITRDQYEQFIANPVRAWLSDSNYPDRITQIRLIITTAGLPYRIEDTDPAYADAIYPGGSNPSTISNNLPLIDAASVESELTCLWYSNYGDNPFGPENRMVNPYQGYRQSSISLFEKLPPGGKTMQWTDAINMSGDPPKIEGQNSWFPPVYGAQNRSFNAGDIYLVCRLDGPKNQGQSAVFAVRAMLERSKRASNPAVGVNPNQAAVVLDDVPSKDIDRNRVYNLDGSVNYIVFDPNENQPPDAISMLYRDDYSESYTALTNNTYVNGELNSGLADHSYDTLVLFDRRTNYRTSQQDIDAYAATDPNRTTRQGIILLATYGYNGDEGSGEHYLLEDGPGGGPLFRCVDGAVFTSLESLNAVTMFSDVQTLPAPHHQGKIVDFIQMGGAGAIGHAFEPVSDALIDNLYLQYNLLADEDGDGYADLTFIEAAFTAIPYLSWSEVVIGDPLMRVAYGPGQSAWTYHDGDCNGDGQVTISDILRVRKAMYSKLDLSDPQAFEKYNDLCDVNKDGVITMSDLLKTRQNLYTQADWLIPPE